jgi:hypothetical protein
MRWIVAALLVAVPVALITWVVASGRRPLPPEVAPGGLAGASQPVGAAGSHDDDAALKALLAAPLAGATVKGAVTLYDSKGLFDYIDGAAPIYIERKFRRLAAAEMATPDGGELTCDIYDMAAPENAQSIFDKERSSAAKAVEGWPEAITGPKSLVFRNGRYYVKLTAFDAKAEGLLPEIAKGLRGRMK